MEKETLWVDLFYLVSRREAEQGVRSFCPNKKSNLGRAVFSILNFVVKVLTVYSALAYISMI